MGVRATKWLMDTARWAWRTKIQIHLGIDLRLRLWNAAEQEAVRVFAANLRDLCSPPPRRRTGDHGPRIRASAPASRSPVVDATGNGWWRPR